MPTPQSHQRTTEIADRAFTEARAMVGAGPAPARRTSGELRAAALRAYGVLSAGLEQPLPFVALGPGGGGVRGLAVFLSVYAAQQGQQVQQARVDEAP